MKKEGDRGGERHKGARFRTSGVPRFPTDCVMLMCPPVPPLCSTNKILTAASKDVRVAPMGPIQTVMTLRGRII